MSERLAAALELLARHGESLRAKWHFDWPPTVHQAVCRLRLDAAVAALIGGRPPALAAIVGGASSGKSTLFNNLLGGHLVSRIAAWGHTTSGPILAVHERHRLAVEQLLHGGLLLPTFKRLPAELDGNCAGEPASVAVLFHAVDEAGEVMLVDLPDFTSEMARTEGDIALSLLPWFDKVVVVVDHERWFDRQSFSDLRSLSVRFGQRVFVEFNRTREEELSDSDRARLTQQAGRLGAAGMGVLEFRRGRGLRLLPPESLEEVRSFLKAPAAQRDGALRGFVAEAANRVLNQNEERTARCRQLEDALRAAVKRTLPSGRDCLTGLTTPAERRQLEIVSRVLRITDTRQWLADQMRRMQLALRRMPVVGTVLSAPPRPVEESAAEATDRRSIALVYYQAATARQAHELQYTLRASAFWDEIRRWTGMEPAALESALTPPGRGEIEKAAERFDAAMSRWVEKVEAECQGIAPYVTGAVGAGALALAVLLIAVPGPVALLTAVAIKGAIGGALAPLAAAVGAGAALGKPAGRLLAVIQEKLIGSPELSAVQSAAAAFRALLEAHGRRLVERAVAEASTLIIARRDSLLDALEFLRQPVEQRP